MQTILVLALLLLARGAVAQELPPGLRPLHFTFTAEAPPAQKPPRDLGYEVALFAYGTAAGADWAITAVCLKVDCTPEQPIGLLVFIDDPKFSVPLGLALDTAIVLSVRRWLRPHHPTIAQATLWILSTIRWVIVTQRIGDLRRRALRPEETP